MVNYKVYKHTSPSGKVYIGITCQELRRRFMNGRGYKQCPRIANAIKKYGWNNFKHEVLFEGLTKEEAEKKEIELIQKYKSNDKRFGYNIDNGGNTSGTHSEETKRKISQGNLGKVVSEKSIQKMREAHKGKQMGELNPFYGRKHTEECKKQHSEFMKGNQYNKGNHHSDEFGNIIKIYVSLREVAREFNHSTATIYKWVHDENNKEWSYEQGA